MIILDPTPPSLQVACHPHASKMRACVACVSGAARCLPVCMLMWDVGVRQLGVGWSKRWLEPCTRVRMSRAGRVTHPTHIQTICKLKVV